MKLIKMLFKKKLIFLLIFSILSSANPTSSAAYKDKSSLLSMQENQAVRELVALDSNIVYYRKKIDSIKKNINELKDYTSKLKIIIKNKEKKLKQKKIVLNKRAKSIYKEGSVSMFEVIMNSKNVSDFLNKIYFFKLVTNNDNKLVRQVRGEHAKYQNLQKSLTKKIKLLSNLRAENEKSFSKLVLKVQSKKSFVNKIKKAKLKINTISKQVRTVNKKISALGPSKRPKGKIISVLATGYGANCSICGTNGSTSTGLKAGRGIAAVSASPGSRILPLGTKIYVPGYGKAVIADIGGGVASNQIDLAFDSHKQALSWGKKWITVTVLN